MKWTESTVTKLLIKDVDGLDPITIYIENYDLGQGKLTIVICGESYSAHWNAMGNNTLEQFVLKSDNHYLSKNLASRAALSEPDYDGFITNIKKQLIEQRRHWGGSKKGIRELWNKLNEVQPSEEFFQNAFNHELLHEVVGDEWWHSIPEVDSSLYKYLCKILDALKACLSERAGVLKPYQVGENDIVLAFSAQSAKQVLCDSCGGLDMEDLDEVEDLSNRLDMAFFNEDGAFLYTLKTLIEQNQDQGERYLTGWE